MISGAHNEHEHHGQPDMYIGPDVDKQQSVDSYWKITAMTFDSEPAAFVWYNTYAKDHGFNVRKYKVKLGKVLQEKYS